MSKRQPPSPVRPPRFPPPPEIPEAPHIATWSVGNTGVCVSDKGIFAHKVKPLQ